MQLHRVKIGANNSFFSTLGIIFMKGTSNFKLFFKQNFPSKLWQQFLDAVSLP